MAWWLEEGMNESRSIQPCMPPQLPPTSCDGRHYTDLCARAAKMPSLIPKRRLRRYCCSMMLLLLCARACKEDRDSCPCPCPGCCPLLACWPRSAGACLPADANGGRWWDGWERDDDQSVERGDLVGFLPKAALLEAEGGLGGRQRLPTATRSDQTIRPRAQHPNRQPPAASRQPPAARIDRRAHGRVHQSIVKLAVCHHHLFDDRDGDDDLQSRVRVIDRCHDEQKRSRSGHSCLPVGCPIKLPPPPKRL